MKQSLLLGRAKEHLGELVGVLYVETKANTLLLLLVATFKVIPLQELWTADDLLLDITDDESRWLVENKFYVLKVTKNLAYHV